MIKINNGSVIIGFDDGYQLGKTVNHIFDNGVHLLGQTEPTLQEGSLFYDGDYYKVGEGRAAITDDKTSNSDGLIRTMAAVGMELRDAGMDHADVVLAVGLPFTNYGSDRKKLQAYYMDNPELHFIYEGKDYHVQICKVSVFPQCYSAIAFRLGNMKDDSYLVCDIGSKTTDIVRVDKGRPIESSSITIDKAMVKWIRDIQRDIKVRENKELPEEEILKVIMKEEHHLPVKYADLIRAKIADEIEGLELELKERNYNLDYTRIIYVGGGASVVQEYAKTHRPLTFYEKDLRANARGYEYLANQIIHRRAA